MGQRLKQHNEGARLLLTPDDFLIVRQTPCLVADVLRHVRRRIGRYGYVEQSVHEHGHAASRFLHYQTTLTQEQLAALYPTLMKAWEVLADSPVVEESDGVYRRIEFWVGDQAAKLLMQDVGGVPCRDIPEFEAAWRVVLQQFPECY